jgi:hypothetical protein
VEVLPQYPYSLQQSPKMLPAQVRPLVPPQDPDVLTVNEADAAGALLDTATLDGTLMLDEAATILDGFALLAGAADELAGLVDELYATIDELAGLIEEDGLTLLDAIWAAPHCPYKGLQPVEQYVAVFPQY